MNPMIIGALAGLAMGELSKQEADKETRAMEKYNKDVVLPVEREKQRYAYWTGTQGQLPGRVPHASRMKEWMKGAATGAMMGQGFDSPTPGLTGDEMPGRWEDASATHGSGGQWEDASVPGVGELYTPGQGQPPYAVGAPPPVPGDIDGYYARPEHSMEATASGRHHRPANMRSPMFNYYSYGK